MINMDQGKATHRPTKKEEKKNSLFFRQKSSLFKVESWFLLHVKRWLKTTNEETPEWVRNAIKQDEVKKKKACLFASFFT